MQEFASRVRKGCHGHRRGHRPDGNRAHRAEHRPLRRPLPGARLYPGEIAYCQRKKNAAESFAARFAAKEAGAKALGTGISHGIGWLELEVAREPSGKPRLELTGRAAEWARKLGVARTSLSLTHSRDVALAVVVMES